MHVVEFSDTKSLTQPLFSSHCFAIFMMEATSPLTSNNKQCDGEGYELVND